MLLVSSVRHTPESVPRVLLKHLREAWTHLLLVSQLSDAESVYPDVERLIRVVGVNLVRSIPTHEMLEDAVSSWVVVDPAIEAEHLEVVHRQQIALKDLRRDREGRRGGELERKEDDSLSS